MGATPLQAATLRDAEPASSVVIHNLRKPYLLFVGDVADSLTAKTAFGLRDWVSDDIVGQWRLTESAVDLGITHFTPEAARDSGARSLVIGVAPSGGMLPQNWGESLIRAATAGLDIVSGLHTNLANVEGLAAAAQKAGVELHNVRWAPDNLPVGTGVKRTGKRLLTVGTDCAIGKKYTALAIARGLHERGTAVDFRATGQTGIMIAGCGIAIDTVVADFLSGAAEMLSPSADADHWDVIEGQGSLFHPAYAGVALGLLHGSQPDALVMCTSATRREIDDCPGFPLPTLTHAIRANLDAAHLTNGAARCVGISINTSDLAPGDADALRASLAAEHGVPCIDPMRGGVGPILDALSER